MNSAGVRFAEVFLIVHLTLPRKEKKSYFSTLQVSLLHLQIVLVAG